MPLDPQDRRSLRFRIAVGFRSRSALALGLRQRFLAGHPYPKFHTSMRERNSPQNAIVLRSLRKTPMSNSGNLTPFSTAFYVVELTSMVENATRLEAYSRRTG